MRPAQDVLPALRCAEAALPRRSCTGTGTRDSGGSSGPLGQPSGNTSPGSLY